MRNMTGTSLRNVRIFAVNNGNKAGFNIYLDFSGQREFLTYHRHNGLLYGLLKDGVRADDLRRSAPSRGRGGNRLRGRRLRGTLSHLLLVVDDYTREREEYAGR